MLIQVAQVPDGGDVKNRFSNPTKLQIGQDQYRKDITKDHQGRLSKRAVMKENGLGQVCLQQRRLTPKGT